MTKYIIETGEAANVGWNTDRALYNTEEEAMKAYHEEIENYIKQTVSDNNMTADEEVTLMKTIKFTVKANQTNLPNKMHLSAQQTYRAQVFTDRKKRAKNGYQKHKKADW